VSQRPASPRRSLLAAAVLLALAGSTRPALARPPNLVLVVADDLGYSDLGAYGGEIETPTLDRLALGGVRFTRFYATPRCSPTRAALLTGVWPHEAGVGHLNLDWDAPAYRGSIRASVPTLAEGLRDSGYATYMVGKWHLTPEPNAPPAVGGQEASHREDSATWPLQRGFDTFYGTLGGSGSYFEPPGVYDGNVPAPWPPAGESATGAYLTDVLGARAATAVERHLAATPERPFFLYLAFTAPHWPLHAPAGEIERYRGRFDAGWDALRAERFRRQLELGLFPADAALPPRDPEVAAWTAAADREWQARRMEVYAAMVSAMDRAVGRVVAALGATLDDTVVLFLSDNGACAEDFRGVFALAPLFIAIPRTTADGHAVRFGDRADIVPGPADTFSSYGRSWAHLSNTPFAGYKHWTHEGGIAVPLIVHWPERLGDRAGAIVAAPAHVVDLATTLYQLAAAGAAADSTTPAAARPRDAPPLRGESLLPLLRGEEAPPRTLYWEHEGNRAIEYGDWKLVSHWPFGWELYDLAGDRFETTDVASREPERVAELAADWSQWAAAVGVETWPLVVPMVRSALVALAAVLFLGSTIRRAVRRGRAAAPAAKPRAEPAPSTVTGPRPKVAAERRPAPENRPPPPIHPR
jgi:arylsulfatase